MIISGDLTLPNFLTPQQFLTQFFGVAYSDGSRGYVDLGADTEDNSFIISSLNNTLPAITSGLVILNFTEGPQTPTSNDLRDIQSITIIDDTAGTRMEITLSIPMSFIDFNAAFDSDGGVDAFYDLLMPGAGPGLFLDHDGSAGNDGAQGFETDDVIDLFQGDDHVIGFGGNDALNGGAGIDTAYYTGAASNYTLTLSPTGTTLEDRRADGDGTDTLQSIERVSFQNDTWVLGPDFAGDVGGGLDLSLVQPVTGITSEQLDDLINYYSAAHVRLPDAAGLYFFAAELVGGTSLDDVIAQIDASEATPDLFPEGLTTSQSVQLAYTNYLARAADQAGLDFWTGVLDRGDVAFDQFPRLFMEGAEAPIAAPELDPVQLEALGILQSLDLTYLEQRADLGALYAVEHGISNAAIAEEIFDLLAREDTGAVTGLQDARDAIDAHFETARAPETGEFLIQLVGFGG